jgi:hypothetical protein
MTLKGRMLLGFLWLLAMYCLCWGAELEYEVKAEYLERFTRFIDWPADSNGGSRGNTFHLCVIGENPFGSYLREMTNDVKFKGKRAELQHIQEPRQAIGCDLLFIAKSEAARLVEILRITKDRPILTVSDTPGFAQHGVLINFYNEGANIRFEINTDAIKRSRLHVSSRLLNLARLVKDLR